VDRDLALLVTSPAWFAVYVALQLAACRLTGLGVLRSEYLGFAVGLAGVAATSLALAPAAPSPAEAAGGLAANLLLFAALAYCYFHFVNLAITARRIRLLLELAAAPGGLSLGEIVARYGARDMVAKRLLRLEGSGQIRVRDGRYVLDAPVMHGIVRVMLALKLLLLGKRSEFE